MSLLDDVKNYLDITWDDPESDKKLSGIVNRGISYLQDHAGGALSFETEGQARALLFDYCRYVRSNALEMFGVNFRGELIALRSEREVNDYVIKAAAGNAGVL